MVGGIDMLTEKDYCDKDLSATLMEMGFRGFGHFYYEKDSSKLKAIDRFLTVRTAKALGHTLAISLYEAQKWLREEKNIHIEVYACAGGYIYELCKAYKADSFSGGTTIYTPNDADNPKLNNAGRYDDFEICLLEGIKESIKILTEKEATLG